MSDVHLRILRRLAHQTQRELERHDTVDHAGDAASTGRRAYLARAVKRTRGQVAAAEQRREAAEQRPQPSSPVRKARP